MSLIALLLFSLSSLRSVFVSCQDIGSNKILNPYDPVDVKLVWNVPTFQCRPHKISFTELADKYGLTQNQNDDFRGDKVAILYDPGAFPAILTSDKTNKVVLRNVGVPQEGNLTFHLDLYKDAMRELVPDKDFDGLGIIDFESWRPIYRQNFGSLVPYKDLSIKIERQRHPLWPDSLLEKEASRRFETSAVNFMEETLMVSKELRPKARWGYYAYPYCFNMSPNNPNTHCTSEVQKENDRAKWLFAASDILSPSLYLPENRLTSTQRAQLIQGRIAEAKRINRGLSYSRPVVPYFWFKYQDTKEFLSKEDLRNAFAKLKAMGVDGIILWGSSNDVNSRKNCEALYDYVDNVLGPIWIDTKN